ncbi:Fe-S oxidoreductase [Herbiconiux moechotypicola]|nr:Fe-S oxidoreductase [Herbiconiux moechotypicola]MCS5728410.1 Fe-S oxidoreductase [Herbiconiux moechotypicola]
MARVRAVLYAPPVARAGYLYATGVALVVGSVLGTGRIRRVDGLFVCTGLPAWAFKRGGTCVGGVYLTDDNDSPAVLRHEAVHRQQWKRYGMMFPLLYALAGSDPLHNHFEIEAGLEDGNYVRRRATRSQTARSR